MSANWFFILKALARNSQNLFPGTILEENKLEAPKEQTPEDVCALVDKHFAEAKAYKSSRLEEKRRECEEFYSGIHWKDKKRTFKNLVFPLVEQEVSVLMDSVPGIDVLARREEREEDSKILEESIHFTLEQQAFFLKLTMAMRSALKVGDGFHYVDYDPDADNGQGMTTVKTIPWRHVFLDPAASELDEAAFVGIKFPARIEELKRRFPDYADKIVPGGAEVESYSTSEGREDRFNFESGKSDPSERYKLSGMAMLEEAWLRDYQMVPIPEEETAKEIEKETEEFFKGINPDIGRFEDHAKHNEAHHAQIYSIVGEALQIDPSAVTPADIENAKQDPELGLIITLIEDHMKIHEEYGKINPKGEKRKYAEGIRLVMKIGKVIVYDGSAPVDDGMVPLVPYYCYKDEESIWGTGEVENILPAQKSFNEMDFAEYESLHLTSNPGWVVDADCGVDPSSITNKRGQVYVKNPGKEFRRLESGQTNPQLSMRKLSDQQFMEIISGINEASQGRRPGGITAAKAIERLQQQTNGRIRLKAASLALYSLPRLGKLIASRNAKYWTTERLMRITDRVTGEVKRVVFDPERIKDLEYDIRVTQGSLAGTDKEAVSEVMAAYVDKGWIPPKVYFQAIDVPNKKKILEALDEADQVQATLQQLAAENEQLKALIQQSGAQLAPAEGMEAPPQQPGPMMGEQ
jgi:hypothetical protein